MGAHNIDNYQDKKAHDPGVRYDSGFDDEESTSLNDEASDAQKSEHKQLLDWYTQEREIQALARYQRAIDDDYYDHLQWSEEDAQEVRSRGQSPLVYNEIKAVIDWILGTERRMRIDSIVLPREEEDVDGARVKTKLMKYLSDVNKVPFARSRAFEDATKSGLGWLEDGIDTEPGTELLQSRAESWRFMLHDSKSREPDMSDARFIFRWRWLDLDIAQGYFPDSAAQLARSAVAHDLDLNENEDDFYYLGQHFQARNENGDVITRSTSLSDAFHHNRRRRVKLIEGWYYKSAKVSLYTGDSRFEGLEHDDNNKHMAKAFDDGLIELVDHVRLQMHVGMFTEGHMIYSGRSPYRHNRYPFTPVWGYRRARDNAPYGVIRGQRDAQDDLNKRFSKTLFLLSTNRVVADNDAVEDWDELADEVAAPDGIIKKKRGAQLDIETNVELSQAQLDIMERDRSFVHTAGGVTQENLGRETNAISGIAIQAKQEQGSVSITPLFDNLRLACQLQGEKQLSLIEQFMTDQKTIRITGKRGKPEYTKINEWDEERQEYLNDITAAQADYVVGEQKYQKTLRLAMFETLSNLIGALPPDVAMKLLPTVFEFMDLPEREDIISEIRKVTGQVDDQDMNDEERAAAEAQARMAKMMEQIEIQTKTAKIALDQANAVLKRVEAQETAVDAAKEVMTTQQAGNIAADMVEGAENAVVSAGPEQGLDEQMMPGQEQQQQEQGLPAEGELPPTEIV